ncbi:VOC family protein [Selenomonas sp. TAMA-11512]|uniref:VOC family protein n=1 Tax=Selenomonas sp. TAMA-11512 TaxID=3095337 RepID=UPI00308DD99D|nr:VOC family protein [Selenomonas sp. TAMA-11512]
MEISHLDHFVLTTAHLEKCLHFYTDILGMELRHENGRYALFFGKSKINIHTRPAEFLPAAENPETGALDLCFAVQTPIEAVMRNLRDKGVVPETGIVPRRGARGPMQSVYLRDPDGNLIELCSYAV